MCLPFISREFHKKCRNIFFLFVLRSVFVKHTYTNIIYYLFLNLLHQFTFGCVTNEITRFCNTMTILIYNDDMYGKPFMCVFVVKTQGFACL